MSGPEFFQTPMGRRFYEHTMPELVRQLERLNDALAAILVAVGTDARPQPKGEKQ